MLVTFDHSEAEARNIRTFWFKPPKAVDFVAGQFIEMTLPHADADDRGIKHWFTLSSSPTNDHVSITTKYSPDRSSTFKQTLFSLIPGSLVTMSEPMGDFVLPKDPTIPLVFVAGGIGITPVHSIVKWLQTTGQTRNIHIIYGASALEDIAFRELFEHSEIKLDIVLSQAEANWHGRRGPLNSNLILNLTGHSSNPYIYVSGPELLVETLQADLLKAGIDKQNLILDFFPNYLQP